jgi:hypothetical protein
MPDCSPYRDAALLVAGAVISGLVGLAVAHIQKQRDAVLGFRILLAELDASLKTDGFHRKSCDDLDSGLARIRPLVKPAAFAACMDILREYRQIPQSEMDRQSQQALAYSLAHGVDTDQRFSSYVRRFEKALA